MDDEKCAQAELCSNILAFMTFDQQKTHSKSAWTVLNLSKNENTI